MLGQVKFKESVKRLKSLSPFTIIEGEKGQGKKVAALWISEQLDIPIVVTGIKIDDIRQMIENTAALRKPIIYLIPDADNMSIGAKNSLLKITEEPPKNLFIVMTLQDKYNTLDTIRSRATIFKLDNYNRKELEEYMNSQQISNLNNKEDLLSIANNPGEINSLVEIGYDSFIGYVDKVFGNILEVTTGNSFKIANKISFKEGEEGFPVETFLKVFQKVCVDTLKDIETTKEDVKLVVNMVRETSLALRDLRVKGINKKSVFDMWVLNLRRYR